MDIDGTGAFTFDTDSCNNPLIEEDDIIETELAWREATESLIKGGK